MQENRVIAVLDTGYASYEAELEVLSAPGYRLALYPGDKADADAKSAFARQATGLLVRWTQIDSSFLRENPQLRAIVRYGAGYENIDLDACTAAGVRVANVSGYGNHAVSDHALALMYACARALPAGQQQIRSHFGAPPRQRVMEFHDKTLGIIGLGRIGGTLCGKARHLFGRVIASDPYIKSGRFGMLGATQVNLTQLLSQSDVISIHCNLTEETTGLIGRREFERMGRVPILVNTARGPVIQEAALRDALDRGLLHSAGIDVYGTELAAELPTWLLEHSSVIATGHYAWYSEYSHRELQRRAAQNLVMMLQGKIPEDCLNPG
jgi:D-3-phosphoglycerate dehydrogenase / 2-oxoglutarate reductase